MYYKDEETDKAYKQAKFSRMQTQARDRLNAIRDKKSKQKQQTNSN